LAAAAAADADAEAISARAFCMTDTVLAGELDVFAPAEMPMAVEMHGLP